MLHIFKALIEIILLFISKFTINIEYTNNDILKKHFEDKPFNNSLTNICKNNKDKYTTYKIDHVGIGKEKTCSQNSLTRIEDLETKIKYNLIKEKINKKIENELYVAYSDDTDLLCPNLEK
jgi:hypothetical protein